jgi:uracil-DNA glycosylase family 4
MLPLPLYPEVPRTPLEREVEKNLDANCALCKLHMTARTSRCIPDQGQPGGILFVGDGPGGLEDRAGKPFVGPAGRDLRAAIRAAGYEGPFAFASATRCMAGPKSLKQEIGPDEVEACRGYLKDTLSSLRPTRIVALGSWATLSVLGRKPQMFSVRRGYGYLHALGIPVYIVLHPEAAQHNTFVKRWFYEDIAWACNEEVPAGDIDLLTWEVHTREDAEHAVADMRASRWFAYDCETSGDLFDALFQLLSITITGADHHRSYTWGRQQLIDPEVSEPLRDLLADHSVKRSFQNGKYDMEAVRCHFGIAPAEEEIHIDTRLVRHLIFAEAAADLETMSELVGMGGIKDDMHDAIKGAVKTLRGQLKGKKYEELLQRLPTEIEALVRLATDETLGQSLSAVRTKLPASGDALTEQQKIDYASVFTKLGDEPKRYAYGLVERKLLHSYNALDTVTTAMLAERFEKDLELDDPAIKRTWEGLVRPALWAYERIEAWGVAVDRGRIETFNMFLNTNINSTWARLSKYGEFNPNSTPQIREILYKQLRLKPPHYTDSKQASTDKAALELLAEQHPFPKDLLEYRKFTKLRSNYAEGLLPFIKSDGRIHPSFNIDGARSGRSSCIAKGTLVEIVRDVSRYPKGVPIENVRAGDHAYAYDNGRLVLRRVTHSAKTATSRVVRLHWSGTGQHHSGYLDLTADHRVLLTSGEWVPAGGLVPGDRVYALSRTLSSGYGRLHPTGSPEISREHRFIYSELCGSLPEHVHHVNGNKLDNRLSNLEGKTAREHLSEHARDCSAELRKTRSLRLSLQHAEGRMPRRSGSETHNWLALTREVVEAALIAERWSILRAAQSLGHDFITFKSYVQRVGFDVEDVKRAARSARKDQIAHGAAKARAARVLNNHVIVRVEELPDAVDVYDLTVEGAHNFIAGELCVHNCTAPNLQTIPSSEKPEGKMAKGVFAASPGNVLVQSDFCFATGTLVQTPYGNVPIEKLNPGDVVFTYRAASRKPAASTVNQRIYVGRHDVVKVTLDNGEEIVCTPEHKFYVCPLVQSDDPVLVKAGDLVSGTRLLPLRRVVGGGGYTHLYAHKAIEYTKEHLAVAEALGRRKAGYDVHHKNEDKTDNRPENLESVLAHAHKSQHSAVSATQQWRNPAGREVMCKGISASITHRGGYRGERNPRFGDRRQRSTGKCVFCSAPIEFYASAHKKFCDVRCYNSARRVGLNHKVVSVVPCGTADVWSIGVDGDKNYALAAGVFVANSQLELRVAALMAGDTVMRDLFLSGEDFHMGTAKIIAPAFFKIAPDQCTKEHRRFAKCFHPEVEVLTRSGWKRILELSKDEEVMQAVPGDHYQVALEWVRPLEVFSMAHASGKISRLRNEGMDLRVTHDHRMLAWGSTGKPKVVLPAELGKQRGWANAGLLCNEEFVADERLLRLAVALQADGTITEHGQVRFGFSKRRKITRMLDLLDGIAFTSSVCSNGKHKPSTAFYISRVAAECFTSLLDGKKFPWKWLGLPPHLREAVLDEAKYWDGHSREEWKASQFYSVDAQSVDVLQALAAITMRKTAKRGVDPVSERNQTSYRLTLRASRHNHSRGENLELTEYAHTDHVACLSVPSSYVLVRDGGIPVVVGQTFNFGLLYGMSDYGMAERLGCDEQEAARLRGIILGKFSKLAKWLARTEREVRQTGEVWTQWNGERARRRPLWRIAEDDQSTAINARNSAVNSPIQGMASDYCLASVVELVRWIEREKVPAKLVLTVHDSILIECDENIAAEVAGKVREVMTSWPSGDVPLLVDMEQGYTWGSMEPLK